MTRKADFVFIFLNVRMFGDRGLLLGFRMLNITNRWDNAYFIHYRIESVDGIGQFIPEGLELDLMQGCGWLSIVFFTMQDFRVFGLPLPTATTYPQINIRVYVKHRVGSGVFFLCNYLANRLAVRLGRTFFNLPYRLKSLCRNVDGYTLDGIDYFQACTSNTQQPLAVAETGTLDYFLLERYRLFVESRSGLKSAEVIHEPWPYKLVSGFDTIPDLREGSDFGRFLTQPQLIHYSPGVDVKIGPLLGIE